MKYFQVISLLHNFIQLSLNSGSAQVQTLLVEIRDGEDIWQWSRLKIRPNTFRRPAIPQKQFITIINIIILLKYIFMVAKFITAGALFCDNWPIASLGMSQKHQEIQNFDLLPYHANIRRGMNNHCFIFTSTNIIMQFY